MRNKKRTVTVGIPAFNESNNIGQLIKKLLTQEEDSFILQKIIIVSDASTDKTDDIIKKIRSTKVLLIKNKKRKGQPAAQNQIIQNTKTDILVLLEADTLPKDMYYISNLIKPILENDTVVLVQGNEKPQEAKSLIGKVFALQFMIYHRRLILDDSLRTWFASGRGGRAIKKSLYSTFKWPKNVPEDVFLHLFCKKNKLFTDFAEKAISLYKSPETIDDIAQEIHKVASGETIIFQYFSETLVKTLYQSPLSFRIACAIDFLRTNPFYFILYIAYQRIISKRTIQFSDTLSTTRSTKQLYETE